MKVISINGPIAASIAASTVKGLVLKTFLARCDVASMERGYAEHDRAEWVITALSCDERHAITPGRKADGMPNLLSKFSPRS
jgi:hypothetical protein